MPTKPGIPKTWVDTDTALTANSDSKIATQKAVKAYVDAAAADAPANAPYVVTTAVAGLSAEVNLGALATGLIKHTVAAGVSTPATATAESDYTSPTGLEARLGSGEVAGAPSAATISELPARVDTLETDYYSGNVYITGINGEAGAMAKGDVVCIVGGGTNTTPTFKFAKADAVGSGLFPVVAMCLETVASGGTSSFLRRGIIENTSWGALTVGGVAGMVWLSTTGTTGNTWTQTQPSGAGNIQQIVAIAVNDAYSAAHSNQSKTMFFDPYSGWNVA